MRRLGGNKHLVYHMDFFPDSSHFVTIGGKSSALWIWDLRKPDKPEKFQLKKPDPPDKVMMLDGVTVTHDNQIVATMRVADIANWYWHRFCFVSWPSQKYRSVKAKQFTFELCTAKKRTVLLKSGGINTDEPPAWWNFKEKQVWHTPKIPKNDDANYRISDDLNYVVYFEEHMAGVWSTAREKWVEIESFEWEVNNAIFSPSGKYVLMVCADSIYYIYETATFTQISDPIEIDTDFASPQFTPDDRKILIPSKGAVHIFDVQTSEEITSYDFKVGDINALKISDDGLMYAVSGKKKEIVIADLE